MSRAELTAAIDGCANDLVEFPVSAPLVIARLRRLAAELTTTTEGRLR